VVSEHHLRPRPEGPIVHSVTPESAGWNFLSFMVVRLGPGEEYRHAGDGREMALVPLAGAGTARTDGLSASLTRRSVFDAMPDVVYVPPGVDLAVSTVDGFEFALGGAPAEGRYPARLVRPAEMRSEVRGGGAATRQVNHVLAHPLPAERLILYEVYVPRGGWSGWPPHCHDGYAGSPYLEETYYFRLDPADGWAMHRNYRLDEPFDETFAVSDGDLVLVTRGFHSSVAAPGHNMWFLNYLAGAPVDEERAIPPFFQPEYAWIDGRWDEGKWSLPVVAP
jgi:5-deoxy-glucuronate isomerase